MHRKIAKPREQHEGWAIMIARLKTLFLLAIFSTLFFPRPGRCGLELDIAYWRISAGDVHFDEKISEGDERNDLGDFDIRSADITSGRPVWEIETDQSKYLFDVSYVFEESLHRLRAGFQYAGTGNATVERVSWIDQPRDWQKLITHKNFAAEKMVYTNFYLNYRLFPLESETLSSNRVGDKGFDLWLTWTQLEQEYRMEIWEEDEALSTEFTTTARSLGIGVGGEQRLRNRLFGIRGRLVYLPFFDFPGQGWDSELKITFHYFEYLTFYVGGKWFFLDVETEETIQNIAQIPGFSNSEATYKGLNADIAGYTIGMNYRF
jgi:hypothetical protein